MKNKKLFILSTFICTVFVNFNISRAQIVQPSEFQRFNFGALKSFIEKNSKDQLNKFKTDLWKKIDSTNSALVYETKLISIPSEVSYYFEQSKLNYIVFSTKCHSNKNVYIVDNKSNDCTTQTLKEFLLIKNALTNLYGKPKRCVGCQICYTNEIEIPNEYSVEFEKKLIKLATEYPNNYKVCISWLDYNNNSLIKISYDISMGWSLDLRLN